MSEPQAVAGAIPQPNNQGDFSKNHYSSFVPTGGDAPNPIQGVAGPGHGSRTAEGDQIKNQNHDSDKVDGLNTETAGKTAVDSTNVGPNLIPESPFVRYVKRGFSDGKEMKPQTYHNSRHLGRGMVMDNFRKSAYWSDSEADIFTMGLPMGTELDKEYILENTKDKHRDI